MSVPCSAFLNVHENQDFDEIKELEPTFSEKSPALSFIVHAHASKARAATIYLPHGKVRTPVFMPVGTKGTIKGLSSQQLLNEMADINPEIILSNTYHLALQPGTKLLDELGGLHKFMNWPRNLLTDSGGFQMVRAFKTTSQLY